MIVRMTTKHIGIFGLPIRDGQTFTLFADYETGIPGAWPRTVRVAVRGRAWTVARVWFVDPMESRIHGARHSAVNEDEALLEAWREIESLIREGYSLSPESWDLRLRRDDAEFPVWLEDEYGDEEDGDEDGAPV
ncbi:hypothetical protein GCM10010441_57030 [Kitasatospora paracochleata]